MSQTVKTGGSSTVLNELLTGSQISQSFVARESGLNHFGVNFTSFGRLATCRLNFIIMNSIGFTLFSKIVNGADIKDGYHMLRCGIALKPGERYAVVVKCEKGGVNESVHPKCVLLDYQPVDRLVINGLVVAGELSCRFDYGDIAEISFEVEQERAKEVVKVTEVQSHPRPGLISVVIPCWNTSDLVAATLKSIQKQTYTHIEVIVVDDKSDDYEQLQDVVSNFECTLMVNDSGVKGACPARNIGWKASAGEYLFFCDSDVVLKPDCLEAMVQRLHDNQDCSWAYCDFSVGRKKKTFYPFDAAGLRKRNCSSTMSLIKASDFQGFDPELKRLQDWDVFLTMSEKGFKGVWVDRQLFHAKDRKGITNNSLNWDEAVAELKKKHKDLGT